MNRPAVIAPNQQIIDATARYRLVPALFWESANTRRRIITVMTMAISTHVILTMNAGFASLAVAALANSTAPDAAVTATAIQMTSKNASSGASGRRLAKPRIRRSIATLGPAENAIPS